VLDFFREIVARCLQPVLDNRPNAADILRNFEAKFDLAREETRTQIESESHLATSR
jgi:hypothetical protein